MRGMIALVTVMTVLLFAGLGLVVYGISTNASLRPKHEAMKELTLPASANVQHMAPWQNGVALYVTTPKGDYLYLVDPLQNAQLRVDVKREK
jgi:hypothetical protein